MMLTIHVLAEIEPLITQLRASADRTAQAVRRLVDAETDGIEVLRMKFTEIACPNARARYVFFAAPNYRHERQHKLETVDGIEVWGIDV
jgi:hypothetical protein